MNLNIRHNLIALGFLVWMIIGSSARIDMFSGMPFLAFFFFLAFVYGSRNLSINEVLGGCLGLSLAMFWAIQNPLGPGHTTILVLELFAWFIILSRAGNISTLHLGCWIAAYSIFQLLFKIGVEGQGLLQRDNSLLNGPIKYGMISAVGYSLLLFRERRTRHPRVFEMTVLTLMLLAIISSVSRTPIALALVLTIYYFLRYSTLTRQLVAAAALTITFLALRETRLFAVNLSADSAVIGILGARFIAWGDAVSVFIKSPILGSGGDAYRDQSLIDLDYPHNLFLETLVNTGIFGFVILVALLAAQIRRWTSINFCIFVVGLTSGNFFLWMKCLFLYKASSQQKSIKN